MQHEFNLQIFPKKRYYNTQRGVFERIIKKRHPELKKEWKDLFCEFWTEFIPGAGMSINTFLYSDIPKRKLKRGFVDGR